MARPVVKKRAPAKKAPSKKAPAKAPQHEDDEDDGTSAVDEALMELMDSSRVERGVYDFIESAVRAYEGAPAGRKALAKIGAEARAARAKRLKGAVSRARGSRS